MHMLQLQIPAERFEALNRAATEGGFVTVEAYLLHVALGPVEVVPAPTELRPKKGPSETQSRVDSGRKGA